MFNLELDSKRFIPFDELIRCESKLVELVNLKLKKINLMR